MTVDYLYWLIVTCVSISFVMQGWLLRQYQRQHHDAMKFPATRPWAWLSWTKAGDVLVRYFGGSLILVFATVMRHPEWNWQHVPVLELIIAAFAVLLMVQTFRNVRAERRSVRQARKEVRSA